MIKRLLAFFLAAAMLFLSSCTNAYSQFHGVWYRDEGGERIALQFSENDEGKHIFIWATYDIEKNEILSTSKGYYHVSGDKITLEYGSSDVDLDLTYTIDGDTLVLSSATANLTLTKFELE